jgi:hypothetical protein
VNQPALELVPVPVSPLRLAYARGTLCDQGYTYEQAMAIPLVRQALECHARAIQRKEMTHE